MDPYSETCVKHDRALRFITRDHLILNSVLQQDCSVLGVLKSKTFRKPRLELLKLLAKKGKSCYVLGSRKLYRQTKWILASESSTTVIYWGVYQYLLLHWAWGKMIQRRSNVGYLFRNNWSIGLVLPPGLSIIFFRLTFVNLGYTAIFFHRLLKRK